MRSTHDAHQGRSRRVVAKQGQDKVLADGVGQGCGDLLPRVLVEDQGLGDRDMCCCRWLGLLLLNYSLRLRILEMSNMCLILIHHRTRPHNYNVRYMQASVINRVVGFFFKFEKNPLVW